MISTTASSIVQYERSKSFMCGMLKCDNIAHQLDVSSQAEFLQRRIVLGEQSSKEITISALEHLALVKSKREGYGQARDGRVCPNGDQQLEIEVVARAGGPIRQRIRATLVKGAVVSLAKYACNTSNPLSVKRTPFK
jgi:hypothetical protein